MNENDLLQAIVEAETMPRFDPAVHVTVQMICDALGVKRGRANDILAAWEKAGRIKLIKVIANGRVVNAGIKV